MLSPGYTRPAFLLSKPPAARIHRGAIYWLPPFATLRGDTIAHPHASLTADATLARQTFVQGTSRPTEVERGAAYLLITPVAGDGTSLTKPTYFQGSALGRPLTHKLRAPQGSIAFRSADLVRIVKDALGFGTGPGYSCGIGTASLRGRIARVTTDIERRLETPFAVVLTSHEYSTKGADQAVVPLYDDATRNAYAAAPRFAKPWCQQAFGFSTVVAVSQVILSLYQPKHFHSVLRYSVDAAELDAIERDLTDSVLA